MSDFIPELNSFDDQRQSLVNQKDIFRYKLKILCDPFRNLNMIFLCPYSIVIKLGGPFI